MSRAWSSSQEGDLSSDQYKHMLRQRDQEIEDLKSHLRRAQEALDQKCAECFQLDDKLALVNKKYNDTMEALEKSHTVIKEYLDINL